MGGMATGAGIASRGFGGYPIGGYPMPMKIKKSKKQKVKELAEKAITGYMLHKARKKNKFLSPSYFGGYGGYGYGGYKHHGGFGSKLAMGSLAGVMAGKSAGKIGKKILWAYVKIQIAKYALKFGAAAAKAYFQYKLGMELDEYMIGKFVHRYHRYRVRGDNRWRYYRHHNRHYGNGNGEVVDGLSNDNITLGE